jgi:hypothetical protein
MEIRKALWQTPLALMLSLLSLVPLALAFGILMMVAKWMARVFYPYDADSWTMGVIDTAQYAVSAYTAAYWSNYYLTGSRHWVANFIFAALMVATLGWFVQHALHMANRGGGSGEWFGRVAGGIALILGPILASLKLDER